MVFVTDLGYLKLEKMASDVEISAGPFCNIPFLIRISSLV